MGWRGGVGCGGWGGGQVSVLIARSCPSDGEGVAGGGGVSQRAGQRAHRSCPSKGGAPACGVDVTGDVSRNVIYNATRNHMPPAAGLCRGRDWGRALTGDVRGT